MEWRWQCQELLIEMCLASFSVCDGLVTNTRNVRHPGDIYVFIYIHISQLCTSMAKQMLHPKHILASDHKNIHLFTFVRMYALESMSRCYMQRSVENIGVLSFAVLMVF